MPLWAVMPAIDATIAGVADGESTAFVRVVHAGRRLLVVQGVVAGNSAETPPPAYAAIVASLTVGRATGPADAAAEPIVARKDLAAVERATFAACFAVAQETRDIERCGVEIVSPR